MTYYFSDFFDEAKENKISEILSKSIMLTADISNSYFNYNMSTLSSQKYIFFRKENTYTKIMSSLR
jgi:type IV secretory pathway VirB6-like protein